MKVINVFFWGLCFSSLFIILQVGLGLIPMFTSAKTIEQVESINSVLLNLSYSYVAGVIIYLLIDFFPEKKKKRKIEKVISPDLKLVVDEMYIFIHYLNWKYLNKENINDLKKEDFSVLSKFSLDKMNFSYKKPTKEITMHSTSALTEHEYFLIRKKYIIELINEIFIIPNSVYLEDDLILSLRNLKNCILFKFAEYKTVIPSQNFDEQMFEFYSLFDSIKKLAKVDVDEIEIL